MNTKIRPSFNYQDTNLDLDRFDYNSFTNNLTDPRLSSTEQIEYEHKKNYIFISSIDRDRSLYPSPSNFKIDLPERLCDVECIEIVAGTLPNLDGINVDPYIYLDIPELNHIRTSSNDKYFGILTLHNANTANFYTLDKSSTNVMPHCFTPVKQKVNSLHIRLLHPDKTVVNYGTQTELDVLDLSKQTSFTFQITTRLKKRKYLDSDFRNTFGIIP